MTEEYTLLSDWITIKVSGPDRVPYLNGIVTLDISELHPNQWYQAAFLTPHAKIRSIFWIIDMEDHFRLITPPNFKQPLIEDLLKYNINQDVKLEDITDEISPLIFHYEENSSIPGFGTLTGAFAWTDTDATEISFSVFLQRIHSNNGIYPVYLADQNPLEAGLDHMITLEKGCFLGQEPISRMYHRGKPRKFLYRIQGTLPDDIEFEQVHESNNEKIGFLRASLSKEDISKLTSSIEVTIDRLGTYPEFARLS